MMKNIKKQRNFHINCQFLEKMRFERSQAQVESTYILKNMKNISKISCCIFYSFLAISKCNVCFTTVLL